MILLGNTGDMVNVLKEPVRYNGYTGNANNHREIWHKMYVHMWVAVQ
jgi:hypothetical protein